MLGKSVVWLRGWAIPAGGRPERESAGRGTTALPGSVTASGRRGGGRGHIEIPRLLGDGGIGGRGRGVNVWWR